MSGTKFIRLGPHTAGVIDHSEIQEHDNIIILQPLPGLEPTKRTEVGGLKPGGTVAVTAMEDVEIRSPTSKVGRRTYAASWMPICTREPVGKPRLFAFETSAPDRALVQILLGAIKSHQPHKIAEIHFTPEIEHLLRLTELRETESFGQMLDLGTIENPRQPGNFLHWKAVWGAVDFKIVLAIEDASGFDPAARTLIDGKHSPPTVVTAGPREELVD